MTTHNFVACALVVLIGGCAQDTPSPVATHLLALEVSVPGDHATIQAAIDAASPGDVVRLTAARYDEDVALAPGVTVSGAGMGATVIFGRVTADDADGAGLDGVTVDGTFAAGSRGVAINASAVRIIAVEVRNFPADGVRIEDPATAGHALLDRVHVHHNGARGIVIIGAPTSEVTNSIVAFNGGAGVAFAGAASPNTVFSHNLVLANGNGAASAGIRYDVAAGPVTNSIVTSNYAGLSCASACAGGHNIIWGNGTDYVAAAAAHPGNKRVDPRLVAPAQGDYRLRADSPAINAGGLASSADHDFDGRPRPAGGAVDIGPFEFGAASGAATLAITEVMANPLDEAIGEFVELYNHGSEPLDAAGLRLDDGDSVDVLEAFMGSPTVIPAGAYALVLDPNYNVGVYGIPAGTVLLTTGDATLGSGLSTSDPVTLWSASGAVAIDTFSHPFNPGNGISVEKDALDDGDVASNWVASPCGASPGAPNCASAPPSPAGAVAVVITEVMANPISESTGEFVELLNVGLGSVDLAGWLIDDGDSSDEIGPYAGGGTVLAPGQYAVIVDPGYDGVYAIPADALVVTITETATLGNGLSTNDPVTLSEPDGTTVEAWASPFDPGNGVSAERTDPAAGPTADNFAASQCASGSSPGRAGCASGGTPPPSSSVSLVITEVMANALNEDTGEFVEIYNAGAKPVDLAGYRLSDGDREEALQAFSGSSTVVAAGAYALVLDAEYADDYAIPSGTVLLRTPDTTIGSGLSTTDPITLRAPTGQAPLSTFAFPFNPGNGISAERDDVGAPDLAANWHASTCSATPGSGDCDGGGPAPSDEPWVVMGLVISEVMANPVNESTAEFIELYNGGPVALDLLDYRIDDGDGSDTLRAFGEGGTVLQPGQFGVILDADYAGAYVIPTDALTLTVGNAAIGNGLSTSDPLTLYTPDGPGSRVVATYSFPFNPGNGKSVERVGGPAADAAFNWVVSTCRRDQGDANNFASPGAKNCVDPHPVPVGTRAAGQPCPSGGADCASGLCALNALSGASECSADCSGGAGSCPSGTACLTSADATWPALCIGDGSGPAVLPSVIINEVVYDGPGTDVDVFVELAGPPGTVLDGIDLVGINGSNGDAYRTIGLRGAIGGDGYFVVAHPGANAAILAAADQKTSAVDFQNGPDSVVLKYDGQTLDAVAYGGFSASQHFAGETDAAADHAAGQSLSRIPDRTDTGDNSADFALSVPTPGAENGDQASQAPTASPLLFSEVIVSPTAAEMIEIYNPGPDPVDLSHVFVADYHAYHRITTGGGAPSSADFRLAFPAGATIDGHGYVTISLETEAHFEAEHGVYPDFDLSAGGVAPAMAGEYTGSASLSNAREALTLFFWDGASDLVTDLDYLVWGSGAVEGTYKTGVSVGSSAYAPDTPLDQQDALTDLGTTSVSRCDDTEGSQTQTGGNGIGGADETSEDLTNTFQLLAAASPGAAGDCETLCVPTCGDRVCGDNGCGGSCGGCVGDQICEDGACIERAGPLALAPVDFDLPADFDPVEELVLLQDAAAFQAQFGVAPPVGIDFSSQWALYYSAGMRNLPGHVARVTEVVDNTSELFVFYELQLPGEGCEVLDYMVPTWTLVAFPKPGSGADQLVPIFGEDDTDCARDGASVGADCGVESPCGVDLICAGTTFRGGGICFPSWMHKTYEAAALVAIPDGASEGVWSRLNITGLATVAMDVIVWFEIAHADPSQLTISLFPPPSYEGEYNYEGVLFDRVEGTGPGVSFHAATYFYPGDETVNGQWALRVIDHAAGTTGTVTAWGLEFTSRWD